MRMLPRTVEGVVGERLISWYNQRETRKAGLVRKRVWLPKHKLEMHYLERTGTDSTYESKQREEQSTENSSSQDTTSHETILFCHGIADRGQNMAGFVNALEIPSHVRILIPDAVGHGQDLVRVATEPKTYQHPSPLTLLETKCEFLNELQVSSCHVVGISMGGALAYWLRYFRPDIVQKSVLIAPALEPCLQDAFLQDFRTGKKRHFCFTKRSHLKIFLRDLCPPKCSKRDPVPKFLLQGVVRERNRTVPPKHFHDMMHNMLKNHEQLVERNEIEALDFDSLWKSTRDVDPASSRLVLWPDNDFICNHAKGLHYFEQSSSTTCFETLENCGHAFGSDGQPILTLVAERVAKYLYGEQQKVKTRK